jgi:hypothetical protein
MKEPGWQVRLSQKSEKGPGIKVTTLDIDPAKSIFRPHEVNAHGMLSRADTINREP